MGYKEIVYPIRMSSTEAYRSIGMKVDLIYMDADYRSKSVFNDIINWYPKLKKGGIICGNEFKGEKWGRGVRHAVKSAAEILKLDYHNEEKFWYFDPKPKDD